MKFSSTILEALNHHATQTPDKVVFTWVDIRCKEQRRMTFKQLEDESNTVAHRLLKLGRKKGDRVMVAYPFGLEFLAGMFGAMKIGVIPCSIYPPNPNELKTDMPKFRRFAVDAGAKYALSTSAFATAMTAVSVLYKTGVKWIGTDQLPIKKSNPKKPKHYEKFEGGATEVCFIQYTSGSTGRPKGVMISHGNLAENCIAISAMSGTNASNVGSTVGALWVPQYHDMGLVAGFMTTLYFGTSLVVASPLDFVANPLLWSDMIETYKATLTCAPNFAYALLLKRLEQANRKANWSCVKRAMFGGEPAQRHVVDSVAKTLSIKSEHIYNIYGLAESVVFLTGGSAYPDSEGLLCCGEVNSPTLKLRIVEDGKEVEEGQVGSIWVQSPRVVAGYYGQSELTTATFANALPSYDGSWLDTGDLGKIVDGQLYVTGRVKDVIIINGKNYYPTDVELSIDALFGDLIRPGRTTAFQHGEDSVGITVEGRKDFDKTPNESLAVQIANHVSQVHGLFVSEALVLKLGVTPKTTSGKLKRSEIRQTTVDGNWKESSILLQFQRQQALPPLQKIRRQRPSFLEQSFSMHGVATTESYLNEETEHEIMRQSMSVVNWNLQEEPLSSFDGNSGKGGKEDELQGMLPGIDLSQKKALPSKAIKAVQAVDCNPSKLEEYFSDLQLSGVSGIAEAWSKAIKTTAAMQAMCSQIMMHLEDKHPSICQLAHSLVANPDWILIDDLTDFLLQLVHQIFVLQWATTFMMDNAECMQQKLQIDTEWENSGGTAQTVPVELQEMLDLPEQDPMYGKWPFFLWIKNRSVRAVSKPVIKILTCPEEPPLETQIETINNLLCLNLLEAVWVEQKNGIPENYQVGRMLATSPIQADWTKSNKALLEHHTPSWKDLYIAWDIHVVAWIGDEHSSAWMLSKLLLPSLIGDVGAAFLHARMTSLYLVLQATGRKIESPRFYNKPILSRRALRLLGNLNLSWAEQLGYCAPSERSNNGMALNEEYWLSKFDQWGLANHSATVSTAVPRLHDTADAGVVGPEKAASRCMHTIISVLGSEVDPSKSWTENGLTSLQSAELRNKVEEEHLVVLPANFEQLFPTPKALSEHLSASEGKSFPKQNTDYHPNFIWNSSRARISKLQMGLLQTLGSSVILLLVLMSVFPCYFLVSWVMEHCSSTNVMVVICKVTVVGNYRHQQIDLLSWDYVRWWFVDRLLHIWESIAGQFLVETKFIWIFYWLLGADLASSSKIESYIREFDLVKVGSNSTIGQPINCRIFSQSSNAGPKLTFHPTVIGNNCQVSGMVSPGVKIGDGCKVEKLSVVEEGAMVPDGVLAKGNPACHTGSFEHTESKSWEDSMLDVFKILWMFSEAYHFFSLSFLVHTTLNIILPSWRYGGILHWILLFPLTSFLALVTSIALKWLLIGKRDPSDEFEGSLWRRATNWACDFHFRTACWSFIPFFGQSKIWNIIFYLHGLDVDSVSTLSGPYFYFRPSNVDFVKLRGSFVANMSLDFSKQGKFKIEIIRSSISYGANLHAGVKIIQSTIPPRSNVSESIYNLNEVGGSRKPPILKEEVALQFMNVVVFASIIPSYEISLAAVASSSPVVVAFAQAQEELFGVYLTHVWYFRVGNWLEMLLYGAPMFGYYARFMGAEVEGDIWYFGHAIYEYGKIHLRNTIVDNSSLNGHYMDGNGLFVADTYASGILHPGCFAVAGSVVTGKENGPCKVFLRNGGLDAMEDPGHSTSHKNSSNKTDMAPIDGSTRSLEPSRKLESLQFDDEFV
ncbi:D-alanine--D-alanyl carrier protein ligase [Seminavis robusta]|uniref:D-alanine--D-alanyl carrier protein ligase n=1 Tax=Seminavis robusta TaxID=568900 RepID=A0A9N8H289_9STRA|nr:D-alanine--D-alanyl carrier protein ligase [Seminavis robusta]|eukprot:Sro14_g010810.1 D-alanine--D-alanyl carrier protein ligase (1766) ;mRNA; f:174880-180507